jgi:hypothetical protein
MMRFLADENLHIEIVRGLRQANYEVLFVPDLGPAGHKDRENIGDPYDQMLLRLPYLLPQLTKFFQPVTIDFIHRNLLLRI